MSDDKVTRLFPDRVAPAELDANPAAQHPSAPNEALVAALEAFLADARAGTLQRLYAVGLQSCMVHPAQTIVWTAVFGLGPNTNYYESLGAIEELKTDFQNRHFLALEGYDPEDDDR